MARRGRGRPKGSKNKRKALSADLISQQCDQVGHNPIAFLLGVAQGIDHSEEWNKDDRYKANVKLADLIHGNKKLQEDMDDAINGQYEIVFAEAPGEFTLPGEAGAARATGIHQPPQIQRLSVSPQDGENSIRD